jgi:hypothetical protein
MSTTVIIPREIRRAHLHRACVVTLRGGYMSRRLPHSSQLGFVALEFVTVLHRVEPLVLEAFEIEVDNLLGFGTVRRFGRSVPIDFRGAGSRARSDRCQHHGDWEREP